MSNTSKQVFLNREATEALIHFRNYFYTDSANEIVNHALALELYEDGGTGRITDHIISMGFVPDKDDCYEEFIGDVIRDFNSSGFVYDEDEFGGLTEFSFELYDGFEADIKLKEIEGESLSELVSKALCKLQHLETSAKRFFDLMNTYLANSTDFSLKTRLKFFREYDWKWPVNIKP